ncbi:MAG: hypothetical protein ACRD1H_16630, partial [Vicinamibacterales bacterium]
MSSEFVVPMRASTPDWLALAVVVVSVALAVVTISLMLLRVRPAPGQEAGSWPATVRDPVLLVSAVSVIV